MLKRQTEILVVLDLGHTPPDCRHGPAFRFLSINKMQSTPQLSMGWMAGPIRTLTSSVGRRTHRYDPAHFMVRIHRPDQPEPTVVLDTGTDPIDSSPDCISDKTQFPLLPTANWGVHFVWNSRPRLPAALISLPMTKTMAFEDIARTFPQHPPPVNKSPPTSLRSRSRGRIESHGLPSAG